MPSSQTPEYLFVAGVFRSGTSMLYASLNQHPAIALMYEPELQSHDLPQRLFLRKRWLENANTWTEFLRRHGFPAQPKDAAAHFDSPENLYRSFADRKQAIYGGEKSPTLQTYLPQLVKRFPNAKIITISRNPAAVFRSIQQAAKSHQWFGRRWMLERALYGQEKLLQDSILLQNQGHRILHTTYENFTDAPESECRRICEYLGIPFDERMTTLENADLLPVSYSPIHIRLHSPKITPSEFVPPNLSSEWLNMLDAQWQRTRQCIARLSSDERPIPPMAQPAKTIQPAIRKGRFLYNFRRWKRIIHHLLPVEFIRIFRATKVLIRNAQSIEAEKYSPAERLRSSLLSSIFILASIAAGAFLHTTSHAEISPLPFFIFPVLAAGWFFGWKQICLFSLLSASAWTFGPKLTFSAQLPLHWIAWNFLSRTSVLLLLGLFAWHLKATLLIHQNQKE
ncbi:MAG: sulfotransferase family protein [Spartobacteria bacterium]